MIIREMKLLSACCSLIVNKTSTLESRDHKIAAPAPAIAPLIQPPRRKKGTKNGTNIPLMYTSWMLHKPYHTFIRISIHKDHVSHINLKASHQLNFVICLYLAEGSLGSVLFVVVITYPANTLGGKLWRNKERKHLRE